MLRKFYAVLLAAAVTVSAEVSFGVDFEYDMQSSEEVSRNIVRVTPFVGIHAGKLLEITPSFGYSLVSYSNDANNESSFSNSSIEPGCGIYFHLLQNEYLGFALGPKVSYNFAFEPNYDEERTEYDSYFDGTLNVSCQMAIDLIFTKHFSSRLSTSLIKYSLNSFHTETEDGYTTNDETNQNLDFKSIFQPSFGFVFTF